MGLHLPHLGPHLLPLVEKALEVAGSPVAAITALFATHDELVFRIEERISIIAEPGEAHIIYARPQSNDKVQVVMEMPLEMAQRIASHRRTALVTATPTASYVEALQSAASNPPQEAPVAESPSPAPAPRLALVK